MISKKEVEHIAQLARIAIKQKEIQKMRKELSKILDYFDKLKEIDIEGVEPTSHSLLLQNVMRKDEQLISDKRQAAKLLELAPQTSKGFLKVKSVLS